MELQKGQKLKITDFADTNQLEIAVCAKPCAADFTCFGVNEAGKLADEAHFIFYNQTEAPDGSIVMRSGEETVFAIALDQLPAHICKLVVALSTDDGVRAVSAGMVSLRGGDQRADFAFTGESFTQERALILCELYRKDSVWRYNVVCSGFHGGLDALLAHYGGQAAGTPAPTPTPTPAPAPTPTPAPAKINLSKISLKKSGESHKINLSKNSGEIHVNLNWNAGRKKLFGGGAIDLDLACMFRLKDGRQGVIQALGKSFGAKDQPPYIMLDKDDRSGDSANGENMFFTRPELLDFAVVFAFIYEGVPNWRSTNASVVLRQTGSPDIEIQIDNPDTRNRFCVFASLTGKDDGLEVKREEQFFSGHRAVDEYYHFGFRWTAGKK